MRRALSLFALLLALLIVPAASAQTPASSPAATPSASPAAGGEPDTLQGLEYVAARQYAEDPSATLSDDSEGVFILTVRIYQFDTEEHARAGWQSTVDSTTIQDDIPTGGDTVEFSEEEIEGLGDRAWATTLSAESPEGDTGFFRLIYVQDGRFLYTLNAIAGSEEATAITDTLAQEMVDREPGEGEVRFNADGTSTGGVWNLLPMTGDEAIGTLTAFADAELDIAGE